MERNGKPTLRNFFPKLDLAIDGDDHFFQKKEPLSFLEGSYILLKDLKIQDALLLGTNSCRNYFIKLGTQCRI